MVDVAGPIQRVTLTSTLWIIPLIPLLLALFARRKWIAVLGAALSAAATGWHVVRFTHAPESERFFLQHLWRLVRLGQLDASMDLALDPFAAALCIAAAVSTALLVVLGKVPAPRASALLGAVCLAILADSFVLFFVAMGLVSICLAEIHAAGDLVLYAGAAVLYWTLGGAFTAREYVPDMAPRFVAARVTVVDDDDDEPRRPGRVDDDDDEKIDPTLVSGKGFLTLTAYPGALVYMDESRVPLLRAPGRPLRAPFTRFPVAGGYHGFRVHPGGGLDDHLVTQVAMGGEREIVLLPAGPSVTFRQIRDQLVVRRLGVSLASRGSLAGLLLVLGALLRAFGAWLSPAGRAIVPPVLGLLLLRVAPVPVPVWPAVLVAFGVALLATRHAAYAGFAQLALSFCAPAAAIPHWCVAMIAPAAHKRPLELAAKGLSAAALVPVMMTLRGPILYVAAAALLVSAFASFRDTGKMHVPRAPSLEPLAARVAGVERWVLGGIFGAVANMARAASWIVTRLEEKLR